VWRTPDSSRTLGTGGCGSGGWLLSDRPLRAGPHLPRFARAAILAARALAATLLATGTVLFGGDAARGQDRPLPEANAFLTEVRARLERDDVRQRDYSYVETQRLTKFDGSGRVRGESVSVIESYPGLPGEERWERVISKDGRAIPAAELRKKDAERQKKAEQYAARVQRQSDGQRATQLREWEDDRRERREIVDDVFRVYRIDMVGREADTIVFSLTPRTNASTRTRDGKYLRYFKVRAWVSESDYEIVKLDVEAIQNVSMAMGLLARVYKGTTASFERRKINGEVWLPARASYNINGRILLFKRLREGGSSEFSNYRKFTVDTTTTIATPVP
jgi:hypothetical protein